MPDPIAPESTPTAVAAPAPAATPEPPAVPAQETTDWKSEARKWEDRAKENKSAAEELASIKEAQKTEQQKLEDRAAAEKKAEENAKDALRARVALEKGLTPAQEKRLIGTTREELLADADQLLTDLGKPAPKTPVPDPSLGPKNEAKTASVGAGRDLFNLTRKKTS